MTRNLALIFVATVLAFTGCKKLQNIHLPWKKKTETTAAASATPAAGSPTAPSVPHAPSKPDIAPAPSAPVSSAPAPVAAAPSTTPSETPAAAAPAHQQIDQSASVIAFCYHNIEDGSKMKALTITVEEFEKEMKAIKDNGFSVIPLQDFLAWRRGEKNIPHKSAIVSIDDGWVSGYTNAWPILKKYGYPFTLFIYINYVGTGGKSLSWQQLEEMRDAGVDIECHTYSHSNLHGKTSLAKGVAQEIQSLGYEGWLKKELIDSKAVLEKQLGIKVNTLAYPYGVYNSKVREVVKQAGYEAAFTVYGQRLTHSSPYDLLGRYAVEAGKPKIFADAMAMIGGGVPASESALPSTVGQLAAASMVTEPMDNATINNPTPKIKANLSTMGDVENGSVEMRVSGVGAMPVQYNAETKTVTAQPTQKLRPGSYTVIIAAKVGGQKVETRWTFKFDPAAKPSNPADAPLPPANVLGR